MEMSGVCKTEGIRNCTEHWALIDDRVHDSDAAIHA